jgi:hypothetical protein
MESIVEIGSYKGKSTHALLSGCKGMVYAVDHFKGSQAPEDATHGKSGELEFLENVKGFTNLTLIKQPSNRAAQLFEDLSVDMVFIDAGHLYEEVLEDLRLWVPKAKKLTCGHDGSMNSVTQALDKYFTSGWKRTIDTLWEVWR